MKAVMLSIQPKWIELILSGKKTVEVRKTKPKIETPFKCYIYETQGRTETPWIDEDGHEIFKGRGQVIGEFVCDRIGDISISIDPFDCSTYFPDGFDHTDGTCLTKEEMSVYLCRRGWSGKGYAWHITDLVIYDKPKELSEFRKICQSDYCHTCDYAVKKNGYLVDCDRSIKRPPQSWCYVEELKGEN